MKRLVSLVAILAVLALLLSACGNDSGSSGNVNIVPTQGQVVGRIGYTVDPINQAPAGGPVSIQVYKDYSDGREEAITTVPTDADGKYQLTVPVNTWDGSQFTDWYVLRTSTPDFNGKPFVVQSQTIQADGDTDVWDTAVYPEGTTLPPAPPKPQPVKQDDGSYQAEVTNTLLLYMLLYPHAYDAWYGLDYVPGSHYVRYYYDPPRTSTVHYTTYVKTTNVTVNNYKTVNVQKISNKTTKVVTAPTPAPKAKVTPVPVRVTTARATQPPARTTAAAPARTQQAAPAKTSSSSGSSSRTTSSTSSKPKK